MNTPVPVTIPPELETAALAAELATRLYPIADTLVRFGLDKAQLQHLMQDPQFRHQVKEYKREWESPLSAKERVRIKASIMVEDSLLELHRIFHDVAMNPQARLDAFKQAVNLADMQPKANAQPEQTKFTLNIQLADAPAEKVVVDAHPEQLPGATADGD